MSLPRAVTLADQGRRLFVTQRGYFTLGADGERHFVSCMFAALATLLEWAGYRLPLHRSIEKVPPHNFVLTLHRKSGAPLDELRYPTTGTTNEHTRTALRELLPGAPVTFATLTDDEFIAALADDVGLRFTANAKDLYGAGLRLPAGNADIGHAYAAIGTRMVDGVRGVFVLDPMGRPAQDYRGEWVRWNALRQHLRRSNGKIIVTMVRKSAAVVPPAPIPAPEPEPEGEKNVQTLTQVREDEYASVARGTPLLDPSTLVERTKAVETADFRIIGRTIDGKYAGVLVNTTRVPGASGLTLLLVDVTKVGPSFLNDPTEPIAAKVDQAKTIIGNAAKEIAEL